MSISELTLKIKNNSDRMLSILDEIDNFKNFPKDMYAWTDSLVDFRKEKFTIKDLEKYYSLRREYDKISAENEILAKKLKVLEIEDLINKVKSITL